MANKFLELFELSKNIPEDERKDYEENINKLVNIPISKLSKNDLKEMDKYFNLKRDMIDNTMKTFNNNNKYFEYHFKDWDLLSVIIGVIIDDLTFVENGMDAKKYVNYSDNETLLGYYSKIYTFTNDARKKKEKRGVKPESESKIESSPYVDNEKPNPNINNPNISNANINNTNIGNTNSNLRESSVIIGVIILLIILLIAGVVLAIINSEYLPLFIVTIPSCIGAWCLYTIYKEN